MKKIFAVLISVAILISLVSCSEPRDVSVMMDEFLYLYGVDGTVYLSDSGEEDDGYITDELLSRIYMTDGEFPESFAIFLNTHPNFGAECGFFLARDTAESERVIDMCRERMSLLDPSGDRSFVASSGRIVFYSTMPDRELARRIWESLV